MPSQVKSISQTRQLLVHNWLAWNFEISFSHRKTLSFIKVACYSLLKSEIMQVITTKRMDNNFCCGNDR